jgi:hypothetical protein
VKALAPQHPEWKDKEPFASLLEGDLTTALAGGDHALLEIVMATHAGMTTVEFEQIVKGWLAAAKHPKTGRLFTEMVYQPMLELLAYLRANGFKNFIVSGGGIEFMRPWTEQVYGIPPEQVVGSRIKTKFEMRDGRPVLVRLPELNFIDDKTEKPVGIHEHIGRRPIAAFGNSVGDQQMLEYTQGGGGARFMLLVLHDDRARFPYGPTAGPGRCRRHSRTLRVERGRLMPVRKFRSVEDMPGPTPRPPLLAENLRLAFGLMELTRRLRPQRRKPGVREFRSLDGARGPGPSRLKGMLQVVDDEPRRHRGGARDDLGRVPRGLCRAGSSRSSTRSSFRLTAGRWSLKATFAPGNDILTGTSLLRNHRLEVDFRERFHVIEKSVLT